MFFLNSNPEDLLVHGKLGEILDIVIIGKEGMKILHIEPKNNLNHFRIIDNQFSTF